MLILAAIGVVQLLLIGGLALALWRRYQAEAAREAAEARAAELRHALARATRVTVLGELAAALAHELNQPLTAILSNAQATRRWLASDPPDLAEIRAIVDDIIADDKRAAEIIQRMRSLLRTTDQHHTRFDLAEAARDVAALLHGECIAAAVTLRLDLHESLMVDGDKVAMQQVLLNLMSNGIASIQESGASVRRLEVQAGRADGTARVVVHDTGSGVPEELGETPFETHFTSRARGLGVDLAVCRRIAEAHGGRLDFGASLTGGATFVLDVPSAAAT